MQTVASTSTNSKLKLNKTVVTKFNSFNASVNPHAVDKMLILTCCDGRSNDSSPYIKW